MPEPLTSVVFLDTETLGLHPDNHPVWEVAWITAAGVEEVHQIVVSQGAVDAADPVALDISGFHDRYDPARARPGVDVLTDLWAAFSNREHIVGAVPSFDEERLRRLGVRLGLPPAPWHYHLVDVEALAVGYFLGLGYVNEFALPWKSDDLSRAIGVEPPTAADRHSALGDARWAKRIFDRVAGA